MKNKHILKITLLSVFIALCYASFTFLKITIPTPLGYTSFHLGNVICVLAALIFGGVGGGLVGSIGMGIGDILDPLYIMVAPKTMILKMMIGIIVGNVAYKIFNINELSGKKLTKAVIISNSLGMLGNIIGEPLFGYFYYRFILLAPNKALNALLSYNLVSTSVNAIITIILSTILYLAIRKRFDNIIKKIHE